MSSLTISSHWNLKSHEEWDRSDGLESRVSDPMLDDTWNRLDQSFATSKSDETIARISEFKILKDIRQLEEIREMNTHLDVSTQENCSVRKFTSLLNGHWQLLVTSKLSFCLSESLKTDQLLVTNRFIG